MKTIATLLGACILLASCQKSQDISPVNTAGVSANIVHGLDAGNAPSDRHHGKTQHDMKNVTVDFSGFAFVPSYSWTISFKSTDHRGETYVFKGDITNGYIHTLQMPEGSYDVTLDTRTTAGASFIYCVFTK